MMIFKLVAKDGTQLWLSTFGARMVKLFVKDQNDQYLNILQRVKKLNDFYTKAQYHGAVLGPICNRIKDGIVHISGVNYQLERNDKRHTLHSGSKGLHRHTWKIVERSIDAVTMETEIAHLDDNLPGNRTFSICYKLVNGALEVKLSASTDRPSAINMTLHPYFCLDTESNLDHHFFRINADHYTEVDLDLIPTGKINHVEKTHFDFRKERQLPDDTVDQNFVLNTNDDFEKARAEIRSAKSGRSLSLKCTQEGLQFYTGLKTSFAIEPQSFPDAINHNNFPSIERSPEDTYQHRMIFAWNH